MFRELRISNYNQLANLVLITRLMYSGRMMLIMGIAAYLALSFTQIESIVILLMFTLGTSFFLIIDGVCHYKFLKYIRVVESSFASFNSSIWDLYKTNARQICDTTNRSSLDKLKEK